MSTVSVSELKTHLSRYAREVRAGGEVQVMDRGTPGARLVPVGAGGGAAEQRDRLVRSGVLRPGTGNVAGVLGRPAVQAPGADLSGVLREDREDRS